jgi:gamma-glutamyltranspeptidase
MALGPHGLHAEAYRPTVAGRRGMVVSGHPLASLAGMTALQKGGTAFDAAVAVAAALGVVEPNMSGIGGDGFIMVYEGETGRIRVLNATGPAPARATREAYLAGGIPMHGIRSVSVPGIVSGWLQLHAAYGKLARTDVFAPAIELADGGFPVSAKLAQGIAGEPSLAEFPSSRAIFTRDGTPLRTGDILVQSDLASSLGAIAQDGERAYRGFLAKAIGAASEQYDGLIGADDVADFNATWQDSISVDYRGFTVHEAPPNSSGHVLLQMLNLVEEFDVAGLGANTRESVHLMVEAKRLAFADREAYLADPAFVDVPIIGLLSKEYAAERRQRISRERSAETVAAGNPWPYRRSGRRLHTNGDKPSDTTCFAVADRWGNAVCQLQSIQSGFGSGLVAPGTGILLNNRMTYWHLDPDHADCLEPGKRVRHTMNPVMVTRDGKLVLVCGTPGADTQVQTNLQVITHVLDHGYSVVEAVEAPRWRHIQDNTESTIPHTAPDELLLEGRFPTSTAEGLRRQGHPVRVIGDWEGTGSEVMIQLDPATEAKFGAGDPRRDGYAIGW